MNKDFLKLSMALFLMMSLIGCSSDDSNPTDTGTDNDNDDFFELTGFIEGNVTITIVEKTLTNGEVADVYEITSSNTTSIPQEHDMGPWCPTNISMNEDTDGGIWLDGGNLYQVTGDFLADLANFYDDTNWNLIDDDGETIRFISDREGCEAAAQPNVPEEYNNYCVQCLPEWFEDDNLTATYYIPINPVKLDASSPINGARGLAFNGVVFDGPAPVQDILAGYTIAAFDNAGGHVNPAVGYHYHTSTGMSKKIDQVDDHTSMIGYALDGFGMYEQTADADGNELDLDLDDCRGHEDDTRGYHYHVSAPGVNEFLPCFNGATVQEERGGGGMMQ